MRDINSRSVKDIISSQSVKDRREERRDTKAEVTIVRKSNGEVVDRFTCTYDAAEREAAGKIRGKENELKYRIYQIT